MIGGKLDYFPNTLRRKPGVYIISPYSSPEVKGQSRVLVKIGIAKDSLYKRIDSYHTALPKSFYTFSCIITKNSQSALELEKHIHKLCKDYLYKHEVYDARDPGEWFFLRKNMLISKLQEAIRDKFDIVRGIFNYDDANFKIVLPDDLGNTPRRYVYPSLYRRASRL